MASTRTDNVLGNRPGVITVPSALVDRYGRPLGPISQDALRDVDPKEVARTFYRDIPALPVDTGDWSIDGIRTALADHTMGMWQRPAMLVDAISADDRVQATLGSRTGGLFSQQIRFKCPDNASAKEIRKAWKKAWKKCCPQSVMSEIMSWAVMLGFAVAQIVWDTTVDPWQPTLQPWHPMFTYYRWDIRKYIALTADGPVVIEPGNGKWFLFTPHGPYRGWMRGAMRGTAAKWFIKGLAWRDWARFNERHGLPIIKAKVPAAGDPVQKANFVAAMRGIGQSAVVGLPQNVDGTGYDVELMEARDRAWESFQGTIDRCDRSIVLPILWQNLTTEVKEGSFAAARVHGDVRQNAIEFDNETLSEAVYEQLSRPFTAFNFDDPDDATFTTWNITPVEDYTAKAAALVSFAQAVNQLRAAGLKIDDPAALAKALGLDIGAISEVDPVQVESKLASKPGGGDDVKELRAALKSFRMDLKTLTRELKRAA